MVQYITTNKSSILEVICMSMKGYGTVTTKMFMEVLTIELGIQRESPFWILRSYDLLVANTWFKKRDSHLVNFSTRVSANEIDYL